jgi:hypothetical protein
MEARESSRALQTNAALNIHRELKNPKDSKEDTREKSEGGAL